MFDWLRRQDKTESGQVSASEDAPGKAQPVLESRSVGQALPELVPSATTAVDGATTGATESGDVGVDGSSARADDAAGGEQESRELGAAGLPLGGSPPDELAGPIGSEAAPPPLSGRGAAKRRGRRLLKPEALERAPLTGEQSRRAGMDFGHVEAERVAGGGFRAAGRRVEAHAVQLEEAVHGARSGGIDGAEARRARGQPVAGADEADDSAIEGGASGMGL